MKLIFMGTPDFAVPSLESLIAAGHDILAVFTQPDKPVGRKQVLTPPDVKVCAVKHGLTVYQPVSMRDGSAMEIIRKLNPDAIIVAAYGKILPKEMLDYPRYGCINVHGSLLPKYRGAAPIQWSVINGDNETGVTIMQMNEGIDTGDILMMKAVPIGIEDTRNTDRDRRHCRVNVQQARRTGGRSPRQSAGNAWKGRADRSTAGPKPVDLCADAE